MIIKNKVSLISTSFKNTELQISKCLNSLLAQTYNNIEVIIVLPPYCNSEIIINSYKKKFKKIKIIKTFKLLNISKSLNIALKECDGEYVARFDFDDTYNKNRLLKQVQFLKKNPNLDFCGSNAKVIYNNKLSYQKYPSNKIFFYLYLFFRNPICHPSVMFKSARLKDSFIYDETLNYSEDLDLWLRLLIKNFKYANVAKYLVVYNKKELLRNKNNFYYNYLIRKKYSKSFFGFFFGSLNIFFYQIFFVKFYSFSKYIYKKINSYE